MSSMSDGLEEWFLRTLDQAGRANVLCIQNREAAAMLLEMHKVLSSAEARGSGRVMFSFKGVAQYRDTNAYGQWSSIAGSGNRKNSISKCTPNFTLVVHKLPHNLMTPRKVVESASRVEKLLRLSDNAEAYDTLSIPEHALDAQQAHDILQALLALAPITPDTTDAQAAASGKAGSTAQFLNAGLSLAFSMASYAASLLLESLLLHHQTHQMSVRLQKAVQAGGSLRAVARPAPPTPPSSSAVVIPLSKLSSILMSTYPDRASRVAAEMSMARSMLLSSYLRPPSSLPAAAAATSGQMRLVIPKDDETLLEELQHGGKGRMSGRRVRPAGLTYSEMLPPVEEHASVVEYLLEAGCGYGPIGSRWRSTTHMVDTRKGAHVCVFYSLLDLLFSSPLAHVTMHRELFGRRSEDRAACLKVMSRMPSLPPTQSSKPLVLPPVHRTNSISPGASRHSPGSARNKHPAHTSPLTRPFSPAGRDTRPVQPGELYPVLWPSTHDHNKGVHGHGQKQGEGDPDGQVGEQAEEGNEVESGSARQMEKWRRNSGQSGPREEQGGDSPPILRLESSGDSKPALTIKSVAAIASGAGDKSDAYDDVDDGSVSVTLTASSSDEDSDCDSLGSSTLTASDMGSLRSYKRRVGDGDGQGTPVKESPSRRRSVAVAGAGAKNKSPTRKKSETQAQELITSPSVLGLMAKFGSGSADLEIPPPVELRGEDGVYEAAMLEAHALAQPDARAKGGGQSLRSATDAASAATSIQFGQSPPAPPPPSRPPKSPGNSSPLPRPPLSPSSTPIPAYNPLCPVTYDPCTGPRKKTASLLHREIGAFMREIEPSEASSRQRQEVVDKITGVCSSLWDGSSVDTYGSFATGLYLPHSDTDVLVTVPSGGNARNARNLLNLLATHLARESWCRVKLKLETVAVPLLKLEADVSHLPSTQDPSGTGSTPPSAQQQATASSPRPPSPGQQQQQQQQQQLRRRKSIDHSMEPIEVDVTFHVDDRDVMAKMGVAYAPLAARDYVLREMAACPEVRPLVLVLKQLVHRNGLNNPYTGGIASHTLMLLVIFFVRRFGSEGTPVEPETAHGERLIRLLRWLSEFPFGHVGIEMGSRDGVYFAQTDIGRLLLETTKMTGQYDASIISNAAGSAKFGATLHIGDPLHPGINVAKASFQWHRFQTVVQTAYTRLIEYRDAAPNMRIYGGVPERRSPLQAILQSTTPVRSSNAQGRVAMGVGGGMRKAVSTDNFAKMAANEGGGDEGALVDGLNTQGKERGRRKAGEGQGGVVGRGARLLSNVGGAERSRSTDHAMSRGAART